MISAGASESALGVLTSLSLEGGDDLGPEEQVTISQSKRAPRRKYLPVGAVNNGKPRNIREKGTLNKGLISKGLISSFKDSRFYLGRNGEALKYLSRGMMCSDL